MIEQKWVASKKCRSKLICKKIWNGYKSCRYRQTTKIHLQCWHIEYNTNKGYAESERTLGVSTRWNRVTRSSFDIRQANRSLCSNGDNSPIAVSWRPALAKCTTALVVITWTSVQYKHISPRPFEGNALKVQVGGWGEKPHVPEQSYNLVEGEKIHNPRWCMCPSLSFWKSVEANPKVWRYVVSRCSSYWAALQPTAAGEACSGTQLARQCGLMTTLERAAQCPYVNCPHPAAPVASPPSESAAMHHCPLSVQFPPL